ncbi:MAG: bifunctional biotin--[acetyl-CoA-carboxylase] ligase/biotin operon repressor BirA [Methylococcales bacterium]
MDFSDKQRQLLQLLADGHFHSGSALASYLGLSRSAVWKNTQALLAVGLEVLAIRGKGYRLEAPLSLLNVGAIEAELTPFTHSKLGVIEIFEQCESTNSYLMLKARQGEIANKVCLAEYQAAGKGRRGRQWVAPFGQNIILSLLWRFELVTSAIAGLSLAIGVAVVRALRAEGIADVGLKWPNDIYWQDRKLGGILIEVVGEANGPCTVVVGLGLNGFLPAKAAEGINQAWVDLKHITGQTTLNRNRLTAGLLNALITVLAEFEHTGLLDYLHEWRSYDCMLNKTVTVLLYNQALKGIVKGINDEGLLLLQGQAGQLQAFASGEISFNAGSL